MLVFMMVMIMRVLMGNRFMIVMVVLLMDNLRNYVNDLVEYTEQAPDCKCIQHDISRYSQMSIASSLLLHLIIAQLLQSLLAVFM